VISFQLDWKQRVEVPLTGAARLKLVAIQECLMNAVGLPLRLASMLKGS
jgi:hypothetical protein